MNRLLKIFLWLFAALILGSFSPLSAAPLRVRSQKIGGREFFNFSDLMRANRVAVSTRGKESRFYCARFSGKITGSSRKAYFNGTAITLNYAPHNIGGVPYVSMMDWQKSLRMLMYPGTLRNHPVRSITIDMGHGGDDPGAIGRFSREKYLTLALGRRLAVVLRAWGFRVFMTRNSDIKLPLERVAALQKRHRSDLFVSIHINAAKDRSIDGVETFCLTPAFAPSSTSSKVPKRSWNPGNRWDANNFALAYYIQRGMLRRTGAVDRAVKRARFVVLQDITVPGVLVEAGFISNLAEERKMNSPAYQEKIVRGIAEGIVNYCKAIR